MKRLLMVAVLCSPSLAAVAQPDEAEFPIFNIEDACGWEELVAGNKSEGDFNACLDEESKAGGRLSNIWFKYTEEKRRACFNEAYRGESDGDYGVDGSYIDAEACLKGAQL